MHRQARSQVVGHNTFLGGKYFCFYYMLKTNFSGRNKIWGALPPNAPPRGYGPMHRFDCDYLTQDFFLT